MANQTSQPTALISVTDKSGLIEFAKELLELNFKIISTGGTFRHLAEAGIRATEVAAITGCPEVLGGRVKTLHPAIHGGILADRSSKEHQNDLERIKSGPIDLVIVNLYNFQKEAKEAKLTLGKAIEHIDIGGPAMLRAAAKNHQHCLPVVDPKDYSEVLERLKQGQVDSEYRSKMASKVFMATSKYDLLILEFFEDSLPKSDSTEHKLPKTINLALTQVQALRYGENSHQKAAVYTDLAQLAGIVDAKIIQGKELSYNNYLDLDAACGIIADLSPIPAMTIIKHTNPCGTAIDANANPKELFLKALASDPQCAFGGIVASNVEIDETAALVMAEIFLECILAPSFTDKALAIFQSKKNLRILKSNVVSPVNSKENRLNFRSIRGGYLLQTPDLGEQDVTNWQIVSKLRPDDKILKEMAFAMSVCKHVKSNAIVLSSNLQTIGVGAGQMSRVDSAKIAMTKARELGHVVRGAVMASDAFFPFRDCVDEAAKAGISAIVQPGGSIRDAESITAANEHGIIMVLTGTRHFRH